MPITAFEAALPFVLRWEGGYVDHPNDPGGATNRGITQTTYDAWRERQGLAPRSVRELQEDEMRAIYAGGYWTPARCDTLAAPLELVHFDTAVNMGPRRAVRMLQRVLGCEVDGEFGSETMREAQRCECRSTVAAYCDAREAHYRTAVEEKPQLAVFMKGWMNRLNALRAAAGVPGYAKRSADAPDFGDAEYIARLPDEE